MPHAQPDFSATAWPVTIEACGGYHRCASIVLNAHAPGLEIRRDGSTSEHKRSSKSFIAHGSDRRLVAWSLGHHIIGRAAHPLPSTR